MPNAICSGCSVVIVVLWLLLSSYCLTSAEVMSLIRINRATLCRYCRLGLLPHMRMPDNSYRFDRHPIQAWISVRLNTHELPRP